jgi:hypothetical protein
MSVAVGWGWQPTRLLLQGKPVLGVITPSSKCDERLQDLEDGPGRVLGLQGAIEERFDGVLLQDAVVGVPHPAHQQLGIVGGAAHQGEHLAGLGFQRHDAPLLVLHQPLAQLL